ncbi:MAG TPA: hypothetical protein EYH32_10440 [Anaerolineae bacterium]|nr:hypothetical protein [Anaerolineae bacterium]
MGVEVGVEVGVRVGVCVGVGVGIGVSVGVWARQISRLASSTYRALTPPRPSLYTPKRRVMVCPA